MTPATDTRLSDLDRLIRLGWGDWPPQKIYRAVVDGVADLRAPARFPLARKPREELLTALLAERRELIRQKRREAARRGVAVIQECRAAGLRMGGRCRKPTRCRCGEMCESWTEARAHCQGIPARRRRSEVRR